MTQEFETHEGTNIIRTPGKFEGEPLWLVDLYESGVLESASDETLYEGNGETAVDVFYIDDDDLRAKLGTDASADSYAVLVWTTEQGFVCQRVMTYFEFDRYKRELEAMDVLRGDY